MTPDEIAKLFTAADGRFLLARWGRPIAPVIFGVEEVTLGVVKGAIEAMAILAGHELAETDPELGANLMVFFIRDWDELSDVPKLGEMLGDVSSLVTRCRSVNATQYRTFRYDKDGAIKACFVFIRVGEELADVRADELALAQAAQMMLSWAEGAFSEVPPLAREAGEDAVLRPEIAALIKAAYDPSLPSFSDEPSSALRVFARMEV